MDYTPVTAEELSRSEGLEDWRVVLGAIEAHFRAGSFLAAASLVATLAQAAEAAQHHPDVDLRYPDRVRVVLTTHAAGSLTTADVDLARQFSAIARRAGATVDLEAPQALELAIDTLDADRIRPFWAAVLGYRERNGSLVDPLRIGPMVWFQQVDEPRPQRNRLHVDVSVPHDQAEARIAAALAAGGALVTDRYARSFWVLADADGNEACICTWQDR